ncbi:endolytic transglycosylase MltG [Marinilactibacillus kalidii]|uniref:endolytic transglycosylase MltG n=1 Tax=Marinilactibacillus kalidii TaxID=2820274 RepID=UPI0031343C18
MQEEVISVEKIYKIILTTLVCLFILLGFVGHHFWVSSLNSLEPQSDESITVQIPRGSSRMAISKTLEDDGVIKSAFVFNYYAKFRSNKTFLQGNYELSPAMSVDEILERIQK